MKKYKVSVLALMILGLSAATASATYMADMTYDYTDNGLGNYTFDLTVANTSDGLSSGALDFFIIVFDADVDISLYSNIVWNNDNGWDSFANQYDPGFGGIAGDISADDSVVGSNGGGIAQGTSLSGFQFSFDYAGALTADQQLFSWIAEFGSSLDDLGNLVILGDDVGNLRHVPTGNGTEPVPEPATMLLFGTGLASLVGVGRKKLRK